jgi:peptidoglycan-associated lipoprotein
MSKCTLLVGKTGTIVLASLLVIFSAGCKKKAPGPPPPPPPKAVVEAPPPPKPLITSFTAEPRSIERGQSSTLNWATSNATDITIDQGIGAVQSSGSRTVSPANTTTYTLTANGPGGSDSRTVTVEVTVPPPPPPPPPQTPKRSAADILGSDVQDLLFDYDKSEIRADQQETARKDAEVLKQLLNDNPGFNVLLEGHCDERGSAEYNLGLGDRRATAAKDYMVQLGVPGDRLKTISYGKERPVCTEASEDCYQRNRRAHFAPGQ